MNNLISIGLPAYKEEFLTIALDSILEQSYSNLEVIIVNDNPGSRIKLLVDNYKDHRIKYFENETNEGKKNLVGVWNKIVEKAIGDFFVLFSDDDIMDKDFIKELIDLTQKYPNCNLFHCRARVIDEKGNFKHMTSSHPEYETAVDFIWHRIKNYRQIFATNFLIRTSTLKKINGFVDFKSAWGADDFTWFKASNEGGIVSTNKILCSWRESNLNISQVGNPKNKLDAVFTYHKELKYFIEKELVYSVDQKEIIKDLFNIIPQKKMTDFGNALKSSSKKNIITFFLAFYYWIKFRKVYNIPFTALIWSFLLIAKR